MHLTTLKVDYLSGDCRWKKTSGEGHDYFRLGLLEGAIVLEVSGDARSPEGMAARASVDPRDQTLPLDHPETVLLPEWLRKAGQPPRTC